MTNYYYIYIHLYIFLLYELIFCRVLNVGICFSIWCLNMTFLQTWVIVTVISWHLLTVLDTQMSVSATCKIYGYNVYLGILILWICYAYRFLLCHSAKLIWFTNLYRIQCPPFPLFRIFVHMLVDWLINWVLRKFMYNYVCAIPLLC